MNKKGNDIELFNEIGGKLGTFLGTNPHRLFNVQKKSDLEELTRMESNLYILIYAWFSNYINNKKPGYSFAAVREHIQFLRFEDTHIIVFLFLNPITHIHEEKRFTTRNILEESKEKTKTLTESLLQNKKITALIHSWLPDMDMVNITNMTIVSHMPGSKEKKRQYNYLKIDYDGGINTRKIVYIPNIFKGEFYGTEEYLTHMLSIERGEIFSSFLPKNK